MCTKKMLQKDERSHNVYENKGSKDKVPDEKTDIYVDMTRLLQKKAAYDSARGQRKRFTGFAGRAASPIPLGY